MNSIIRFICTVIVISFSTIYSSHYYVDFKNGDDKNSGTTHLKPLKHCPGDTNATGKAAQTRLVPGDIVYFKKGIRFLNTIRITNSGKKIIDGSYASITAGGKLTDTFEDFSNVTSEHFIYIKNTKESIEIKDNWVFSCGFWKIASVDSKVPLKPWPQKKESLFLSRGT